MTAALVVTPTLSEAAAKRLTMQIKLMADSIADQIDRVTGLIAEAKSGRADVALGYPSWTAYCAAEFAGALPRLEQQSRRELVANLTELGMSTRAIAPIAGTTHKTVVMDRREQVVPPVPPDADGGEVIDSELIEEPAPAPRSTVGMDNKMYPSRPVVTGPAKRRRPLPDAYRVAIRDLTKAVERVQRLHVDDRFPSNRDGLLDRHRDELRRIACEIREVVDNIGASPTGDDVRRIAATWAGTR